MKFVLQEDDRKNSTYSQPNAHAQPEDPSNSKLELPTYDERSAREAQPLVILKWHLLVNLLTFKGPVGSDHLSYLGVFGVPRSH